MFDALPGAFHGIPADAQLVAGYIDSGGPQYPVMTDAEWALYPNAVHVRIATQAGTNDGHVLDVESGDATPEQAPGWVKMRRAAGADPSVYCSSSAWQTVRDQFAAQGIPEPHWWIASYSQPPDTTIPAGAVAHQWGGNMDGGYDVSSVADFWPGVDVAAPAHREDDMDYIQNPHTAPTQDIWCTDGIFRRQIQLGEWNIKHFLGANALAADAAWFDALIPIADVASGLANHASPTAAKPLKVTLTGTAE